MRVFTIVLVPALLTVLAIAMGIVQRRRRARSTLMRPRTLGILVGRRRILVRGRRLVFRLRHYANRADHRLTGGTLMFPGLAAKSAVMPTRIEITYQGKQTVIEKRPDGRMGHRLDARLSGAGSQVARRC